MNMPRDLPLSSVDPRYRDLLLRGSRERFLLTCESEKQATRFRQTLQAFRFRMKKHHGDTSAGRAEWEPLYGCIIRKDGCSLIFEPRFAEFDSVLGGTPLPTAPRIDASDLLAELKSLQDPEEDM
jgi:hypothetical protein